MNGIRTVPVIYAGTIRFHDIEFIVVPTNIPIPFVGIIESGYFAKTKAWINLQDNFFEVLHNPCNVGYF